MKHLFLVSAFTFILSNCIAQHKDTGVSESVDILSPAFPFYVNVKTTNVILPDSLGGKDDMGIAALAILIDSTGKLKGFNIKKLSVKRFGENIIDYVNVGNRSEVMKLTAYPNSVARYYRLLTKSISPVKIRRNLNGNLEPLNEFVVVIRLCGK